MSTILQKRIEEATNIMFGHQVVATEAMKYILQNQWISVEEALPDKGQDVLVAVLDTKTNTYFFGFDAIVDDSVFLRDKNGFPIETNYHKITHWMLIPSLEGGKK